MEKKSFILFTDRKKEIDMLSDAECGILFKAIFQYVDTGEKLETNNLTLRVLFSFLASQIDENMEKWETTCKKRSEAGKKGMASRWGNKGKKSITKDNNVTGVIANDNKAKQTITKITDTDTVTDTVSVSKDTDTISQNSPAPEGACLPAQCDEVIPWDKIDFELV